MHLDKNMLQSSIILFGEIHGTNESPAFFFDYICQLEPTYDIINVFLEIPSSYQGDIDHYMQTKSSIESDYSLIRKKFWNKKNQDGRTSISNLQLLRNLKHLNHTKKINVFPVAPSREQLKSDLSRTEIMFSNIVNKLEPNAHNQISLALLGRNHVVKRVRHTREKSLKDLFSSSGLSYAALLIKHSGGKVWNCIPDKVTVMKCGEITRNPDGFNGNNIGAIEFNPTNRVGHFYVGEISSSPPAVTLLR